MTNAVDRVLREALELAERDRAMLAARILESLDAAHDTGEDEIHTDEIQQAWEGEIERQSAAVLNFGHVISTPWGDVRRPIG